MLKVVVIDGNAISRNLLTTILVNAGYDVVGDANISSAGLASMVKLHPQIVCIDIGSPEGDGMVLLDTLHAELPKALLFLVSGKLDPATVQGALQRGVQGFIVKPFNAATVLDTFRKTILKLARQHRPDDPGSHAI
ncbi:MAG TPA: response regulator [Burkholderiaceae bacterium]|nr:response regulator [Burkholderiaceae bacterium]